LCQRVIARHIDMKSDNILVLASYFENLASRRYEKENVSEKEFFNNPNYVQPKNWLLHLKQFVSSEEDPDYYIRFSGVKSLTINPMFEKANLFGIYAFAFTRPLFIKLLSKEIDLIFGETDFILIFKPKDKSKILNKLKYSIDDYKNDLNKIRELYFPYLSEHDENIFNEVAQQSLSYFNHPRFFLMFFENLRKRFEPAEETNLPIGSYIYNSTAILRNIGYHGLYDGKEAVFFSGAYLEDPLIFQNPLSTK